MVDDIMYNWKHIFKLDPAKTISKQDIKRICESGTDAIIVGGTDNITMNGIDYLITEISKYDVPTILEVSIMNAITIGFDYYFIPAVMNSKNKKWMMDIQHQAIKKYKDLLEFAPPLYLEGYCILNEDAKAFIKTDCVLPEEDDVIAYAYMAERLFRLPIFYLEYSGMYGDPNLVRQVREELSETLLFYGGGIENKEQATEMKEHADVIVVGNSLYTDIDEALKTVAAVK